MTNNPEHDQAVLHERARRLGEPDLQDREAEDPQVEVVAVSVGATRYALPLSFVREVARAVTITPLPSSPPHFAGLARVRGRLVAVFALEQLLARPGALPHESTGVETLRIVVVCGQGDDELGLLVDSVAVERVRSLPDAASTGGLLRGVLASGALLLDAEALFDDPRAHGTHTLPGIEL